MNDSKQISVAVIKRLPRYYRYLGELLENNVTRISSTELGRKMNVTASQIRQDLNNFGCFGQQGYGYNVETLYTEIKKILGLDKEYNMAVIGSGNLGQALVKYDGFKTQGFRIIAMFDNNPQLVGSKIQDIIVADISEFSDFIVDNRVDIAILALPKNNALDMAKIVIQAGIKAIWNFSSADLRTPKDVIVENVHLTDSLMTLSYQLNGFDTE